jgi:hypothetical protein
MFRPFPRERQDWLRLALFPFQAFAILAHLMSYYLVSVWPHRGSVVPLNHFYDQISTGYVLCFLVLLIVGFCQLAARHRVSGIVNLVIAAWCVLSLFLPGWAQA